MFVEWNVVVTRCECKKNLFLKLSGKLSEPVIETI